jgi:hypothetical protein
MLLMPPSRKRCISPQSLDCLQQSSRQNGTHLLMRCLHWYYEGTCSAQHVYNSQILEMLEMTDIADRLVGVIGSPDGLAPGQRKR